MAVISPPNYQKDFLLYLAASDTTVGMVLVQTDDVHFEHVIYYLSRGLVGVELKYPYVEKLALASTFAVHKFYHYIILRMTIVISDANLMKYILSRQILGGHYSKWVVILSEFDLVLSTPKAKKSLVFAELMARLLRVSQMVQDVESLPDDSLILIDSSDPWYEDILVCLQTQHFRPLATKDNRRRIRHLAQHYLIVGDTLYHRGVHTVLCRCVIHEEAKMIMNDCHSRACGGHLSGLAIAQKILRGGYFWPTIFKDCISAVKKCHPCQIFSPKMCMHPAPLHPIVSIGPFAKWGIDFTTCNPPSATRHHYIIVAVDYFMKWAEAMPTYNNDAKTLALFLFNHVIAKFDVPKSIVTDHGTHFCNAMMVELTSMLHLDHEHSSPYYPQANGQVESINRVLKTMLQWIVGAH